MVKLQAIINIPFSVPTFPLLNKGGSAGGGWGHQFLLYDNISYSCIEIMLLFIFDSLAHFAN